MIRRFHTTTLVLNRHPLLPKSTSKSIDPQFQMNQDRLAQHEPWVPSHQRRRARRQRMAQERMQSIQNTFDQLKERVLPRMPQQGPAVDGQHAPHPDPMMDYQQQMEMKRKLYFDEMKAKEETKRKTKADRALDRDKLPNSDEPLTEAALGLSVSATDQSAAQEDPAQLDAALEVLEAHCTRAVKKEKQLRLVQVKLDARKEALVRLYRQADQFVTAETLEQTLDAFFAVESKTHSLPIRTMRLLAMERLRLDREMKVMDVLNGTLDRRQCVQAIEQEHQEAAQSLNA